MLNPDVIDRNAHEGSQSAPESDAQPEGDASRDAEGSPPVAAHPKHTLGAPRERQYEQHELSSLFPRMEAGAFARLVVNISQQGLLESITIYEGKILDGFHRDEACFVAGKQPTYVDLDPSLDAFEFVLGKNMERRQMTVSQISVVMAKGATHPRGRQSRRHSSNAGKPEMDKNVHLEMIKEPEGVVIGEARVDTGGSEERDTTDDADPLAWANPSDDADAFDSSIAVTRMEPPEPEAAMMTNAQAAKMAGVSRSSIKIAKRLINADNELLLDAVMQHSMSGGHALALLALPVDDQIQAVNQFIEGKKEGEKRKMVM